MYFNSLHFLVFFPAVVAIYFSIPHRVRWFFLLLASYYFYMAWKPEYIILIVISTLVDYFVALKMEKTQAKHDRKKLLIISLVVNLGMLFAFKYFNFFNDSTRALFDHFNIFYNVPSFKLLLPVGISFYTFQTLSYTIDVYRGKKKAERHLGIFALYVSFFPQLVAGPIERSTRLLPQFFEKKYFEYKRATDGVKLILWGFFKKIVIADRLALFVDMVYADPTGFGGLHFIVATVFFAFQIYCDFSGYSDIAIGSAQVLGYDLMDNFKRPYFSKIISEFWRRWHISLMSWFRDYLYIPLGGNRVSMNRWYGNILAVFLISGLWHGASWTFVAWGGVHGLFIITSRLTRKIRKKAVDAVGINKFPRIYKLYQVFITFVLVNIGWVFFRAESISDAFYIFRNLFTDWSMRGFYDEIGKFGFFIAVGAVLFMEFIHLLQRHVKMRQFLSDKPIWLRWPIYWAIIYSILIFGVFGQQEFIYFQF